MRFHKNASNVIAKERLRMMVESEPAACSPEKMALMKKEISEIVKKHLDLSMEMYDIKIVLKQKR